MKFAIDAMSCKNNTVGIHYHIRYLDGLTQMQYKLCY